MGRRRGRRKIEIRGMMVDAADSAVLSTLQHVCACVRACVRACACVPLLSGGEQSEHDPHRGPICYTAQLQGCE